MKKLILMIAFIASGFFGNFAAAQHNNISHQPQWGPVGHDYVQYYFLPDLDAYYDVSQKQFIYQENGSWVRTASVPARFKGYNLYNGYKAVINEPHPYQQHAVYQNRYAQYRGQKGQATIRHSRDTRYGQNQTRPGNDVARSRANENSAVVRGNGNSKAGKYKKEKGVKVKDSWDDNDDDDDDRNRNWNRKDEQDHDHDHAQDHDKNKNKGKSKGKNKN